MWPSNTQEGPQLTYGIDGNPYYVLKNQQEEQKTIDYENSHEDQYQWQYPKTNSSRRLHKVKYSTKRIISGKKKFNNASGTGAGLISHEVVKNIPDNLKNELLKESHNWSSNHIYDPTVSDILVTSEVKHSKYEDSQTVIAFVSGNIGSVFNIASLGGKQEKLFGENVVYKQQQSILDNFSEKGIKTRRKLRVDTLKFNQLLSIDVNSTIKQIKFPENPNSSILASKFCAVRTETEIFVFKVFTDATKENPTLKIELVGSVRWADSSKPSQYSIADVEFNPWNFSQFVTVDVKGHWQVWSIKELAKAHIVKENHFGKLDNFQEVSNWKKCLWGQTVDELFIFDRTSTFKIDFGNNHGDKNESSFIMRKVMDLGKKSKFLQVYRCPDEPKEVFIFTSKEIKWFLIASGIPKPLLSWKHHLNADDVSLRCSINSISDTKGMYDHKSDRSYIIVVSSLIHSVNFFYHFKYLSQSQTHQMVSDPYFIKVNLSSIIQNNLLFPVPYLTKEVQLERLLRADTDRKGRRNRLSSRYVLDSDESSGEENREGDDENQNGYGYSGQAGEDLRSAQNTVAKLAKTDVPVHEYFSFYQISSNFEITRTLLSTDPSAIMYKYRANEPDVRELLLSKEQSFLAKSVLDDIEDDETIFRSYFYSLFHTRNKSKLQKLLYRFLPPVSRYEEIPALSIAGDDAVDELELIFESLNSYQKQILRFVATEIFHLFDGRDNKLVLISAKELQQQIKSVLSPFTNLNSHEVTEFGDNNLPTAVDRKEKYTDDSGNDSSNASSDDTASEDGVEDDDEQDQAASIETPFEKILTGCSVKFTKHLLNYVSTELTNDFFPQDIGTEASDTQATQPDIHDTPPDKSKVSSSLLSRTTPSVLQNYHPETLHPRTRLILQDWSTDSLSPSDATQSQFQSQFADGDTLLVPQTQSFNGTFPDEQFATAATTDAGFPLLSVASQEPKVKFASQGPLPLQLQSQNMSQPILSSSSRRRMAGRSHSERGHKKRKKKGGFV